MKNVVVIVLDSLRKDRVSSYNPDIDFTENIQELGENGEVFDDAVAQAPWTLPSHASMFTGMYPWEHGTTQKNTYLDKKHETLAEKFSEEGYETFLVTPNVWLSPHIGMTRGFNSSENFMGRLGNGKLSSIVQRFVKLFNKLDDSKKSFLRTLSISILEKVQGDEEENVLRTEDTVEEVKKFLDRSSSSEKPFFLFTNVMEPHEPYNPPKKYLERHEAQDLEEVPQQPKDYFSGEKEDLQTLEKVYNASVDYTDDKVGEIISKLEKENLKDDTVLVVVSDHGQALGENGIYGHQFTVCEETVSVPLIIHGTDGKEEFDGQIELRQLYDMLPFYAGISDRKIEARDYTLGGYNFPDVSISQVPEEKKDEYYRKFGFARSSKGKIVRSNRVMQEEYSFEGQEPQENEREKLRKKVDQIDYSREKESSKQEQDEEVKEKLEDLGYK